MSEKIIVPTLGESVTEATVSKWLKSQGEEVSADEPLVELETDKVTLEVPAPVSGQLTDIKVKDGDTVEVGAILGAIAEGAVASEKAPDPQPTIETIEDEPIVEKPKAEEVKEVETIKEPASVSNELSPAVRKIVAENPQQWVVIDGNVSVDEVTKQVMAVIDERF